MWLLRLSGRYLAAPFSLPFTRSYGASYLTKFVQAIETALGLGKASSCSPSILAALMSSERSAKCTSQSFIERVTDMPINSISIDTRSRLCMKGVDRFVPEGLPAERFAEPLGSESLLLGR